MLIQALTDRGAVRPLRLDGPIQLEVDGCTLRYAAPDFPTAYRVTELIATLGAV